MNFLIKPLKFPSIEAKTRDWQIAQLFHGQIGSFENFSSHTSTLKPNTLPHKFHSHNEEELIISLFGNLEVLTSDSMASQNWDNILLEPGSFAYHSPGQLHTLRCSSPEPAKYLIFKWRRGNRHEINKRGAYFCDGNVWDNSFKEISDGFGLESINGLMDHTKGAIQAHFSRLEPVAGYKMHKDNYDILAVLLEGELETFNISIRAPAFIFFAAGTPHGFNNPNKIPARYIVFEFS